MFDASILAIKITTQHSVKPCDKSMNVRVYKYMYNVCN